MVFLRNCLALAAILISSCTSTPLVRIENLSKEDICYKVEWSNGTGVFPNHTVCAEAKGDQVAGFWLDPGEIINIPATNSSGISFNGAITAVLKNNTVVGARNEIDFTNVTFPYWDVDYQYGISNGTCGLPNGSNLSGEQDTLGKANKAWQKLNQTTKQNLLKLPQYLQQDANGSLTYINMGIDAWPSTALDVIKFFQITAGFNAYMSPGSEKDVAWPKNSTHQKLVDMADRQVCSGWTDTIVVTSY